MKHLCVTEVLERQAEVVDQGVKLFFQDGPFKVLGCDDHWLKLQNKVGKILTITSTGGFGYNEGSSWLQYEFYEESEE